MDGMAYSDRINPIAVLRCPRCGKKTIFKDEECYECPDCGELYFDGTLGIWRVGHPKTRNFCNDYNAEKSDK